MEASTPAKVKDKASVESIEGNNDVNENLATPTPMNKLIIPASKILKFEFLSNKFNLFICSFP